MFDLYDSIYCFILDTKELSLKPELNISISKKDKVKINV